MRPEFSGLRYCTVGDAAGADLAPSDRAGNSGAGAMLLAKWLGADRIVLLGYDCKPDADGNRHWHGKHQHGLKDAESMGVWPRQFRDIVPKLGTTEVVNASRGTALDVWPRAGIAEALS